MAQGLERLWTVRNRADYDADLNQHIRRVRQLALWAVQQAREVFVAIEQLSP